MENSKVDDFLKKLKGMQDTIDQTNKINEMAIEGMGVTIKGLSSKNKKAREAVIDIRNQSSKIISAVKNLDADAIKKMQEDTLKKYGYILKEGDVEKEKE